MDLVCGLERKLDKDVAALVTDFKHVILDWFTSDDAVD
jgi:hypothetical protein